MKPDWYVCISAPDFEEELGIDIDFNVWIHVRAAANWCIEDVMYGVPRGAVSPGFFKEVIPVDYEGE